jgi:hypothetical protein
MKARLVGENVGGSAEAAEPVVVTKKNRVGSLKTKPALKVEAPEAKPESVEPARGFFLIEEEKTPVEQPVATVVDNAELAADLTALWDRIWRDEAEGSDRDDALGEMVYTIAQKLRGGSKSKAKNGDDPFKRMALDPACPVEAKALRRQSERWSCILAIKDLGESHPRLGVTHYAATQRLSKNLSKRLEFLRDAVAQKMSVARLKAEVKKFLGDPCEKPKNWRQRFCDFAYAVTQEIFDFSAQMEASGESIRAEEKTALCSIRSAIDRLLGGDSK